MRSSTGLNTIAARRAEECSPGRKPWVAETKSSPEGTKETSASGTRKLIMRKESDHPLRQHLIYLLTDGGAHAKFEDVIAAIPAKLRGQTPAAMPHSPWMLLEHMRIAQWDILEFSRNPKHKSPEWPESFWPATEAPPNAAAWNESVKNIRKDLKSLENLIANPKTDLFAKIPWGDGQTILREAMLVADHNAYHLGQLVDVLRLLGAWSKA